MVGFVKLQREVLDTGLIHSPKALSLYVYLLIKAVHKPCTRTINGCHVCMEAGQWVSGRKVLANELNQTEREVRTGLSQLEKLGLIAQKAASKYSTYTIVSYGQNYLVDQQVDQQSASKAPADGQQSASKAPQIKECKNERMKESKNEEVITHPIGCMSAEPPKKSNRGSRLHEDWFLPKSWGDWALAERPDLSTADIKKQADCFRDYWVSVAGAKGVKADWEATWRNWIRRVEKKGVAASSGGFASAMEYTRNQILGGVKNGNGFTNEAIDITPTGAGCRGIESF